MATRKAFHLISAYSFWINILKEILFDTYISKPLNLLFILFR